MNKVGILTYHTGYNYGASLQAYALQNVLFKRGIDNEIIHFEKEDFLASREMFSRRPRRMKEIIKFATRIPYYKVLKKRQEYFDGFTERCLVKSPLFRTEDEVKNYARNYDCIVCGSDQIWNLSSEDKYSPNLLFYLNFPKKEKRVAYAASFGKWVNEADNSFDTIGPLLHDFDAISVRELSGVDFLREHGIPATQTLDPTLLLDMNDYEKITAERIIKEDYVLVFSWNCNDDVIECGKRISNMLGLPVYHLIPPPRAILSGVKRKLDVGPKEFLSAIKYASFVVTNSFHGTAFSTTFKKDFFSIVTGEPDPRMKSLMHVLGMDDHLVKKEYLDINQIKRTDYDAIEKKKQSLREESFRFIDTEIGAKT